jgi:peroxiredoxin Q/BCP
MRPCRVCSPEARSQAGAYPSDPVTRLHPGDAAPAFSLAAADGRTLTLDDLRGTPSVLYFYPAADTPGCTTQACDFRDNLASLQAHGYQVVGVSPDEPAALAAFAEKYDLTFPLLADPDRQVLEAYGAYGEKTMYGRTVTGVIRSTFVLDADGRVQKALYNVRAKGHVAKLRRELGID